MKCLVHIVTRQDPGKELQITDTNWSTVVKSAQEWLELDGERQKVAEQYKDVFQGKINMFGFVFIIVLVGPIFDTEKVSAVVNGKHIIVCGIVLLEKRLVLRCNYLEF